MKYLRILGDPELIGGLGNLGLNVTLEQCDIMGLNVARVIVRCGAEGKPVKYLRILGEN